MKENLKKYTEFVNELNSSTWKSASKIAKSMHQSNLSKKFSDKYKSSIEIEKTQIKVPVELDEIIWDEIDTDDMALKVLKEYTFDYYVDSYLELNGHVPYEKVTKMKIIGYEYWGVDTFAFILSYDDIDIPYDDIDISDDLFITIYSKSKDNIISNHYSSDSKFANKKSALLFMKTLEKLYVVHDYKRLSKIVSNINDVELKNKVTNGQFRDFIDRNFGSWKGFISKINIRTLYDTYE